MHQGGIETGSRPQKAHLDNIWWRSNSRRLALYTRISLRENAPLSLSFFLIVVRLFPSVLNLCTLRRIHYYVILWGLRRRHIKLNTVSNVITTEYLQNPLGNHDHVFRVSYWYFVMSVWLTWRNDHQWYYCGIWFTSGSSSLCFSKVLTFFSQYFREIMKELMLQGWFWNWFHPYALLWQGSNWCTRYSPPGGIFCHF